MSSIEQYLVVAQRGWSFLYFRELQFSYNTCIDWISVCILCHVVLLIYLLSSLHIYNVIIHSFDSPLMLDLTGNKKFDRLPILVSKLGDTKLLDIPKISAGTGQAERHMLFTMPSSNGSLNLWSAECVLTQPALTLVGFLEHASYLSSY